MLAVIVTALVVALVFGVAIALAFPSGGGYLGSEPNCGGCLVAILSLSGLIGLALMYFGKWLL